MVEKYKSGRSVAFMTVAIYAAFLFMVFLMVWMPVKGVDLFESVSTLGVLIPTYLCLIVTAVALAYLRSFVQTVDTMDFFKQQNLTRLTIIMWCGYVVGLVLLATVIFLIHAVSILLLAGIAGFLGLLATVARTRVALSVI